MERSLLSNGSYGSIQEANLGIATPENFYLAREAEICRIPFLNPFVLEGREACVQEATNTGGRLLTNAKLDLDPAVLRSTSSRPLHLECDEVDRLKSLKIWRRS